MILNLFVASALFVVFGYFEKTLQIGWIITAALLLHAIARSCSLFSYRSMALIALFAIQFSLADKSRIPILQNMSLSYIPSDWFLFCERQRIGGAVFLAFVWFYLKAEVMGWVDVTVSFSPHEQTVRKYLLQHDPSMLYKVS